MSCLSDAVIEDFARGALAPEPREAALAHLSTCADCASLVAEYAKWALADGQPPADDADPGGGPSEPRAEGEGEPVPLAPGTRLGRYRVVRPVGAGAGGAVYEGHDPHLGRKVAIKVLHRPAGAGGASQLLHEARAMARLSHPAVIAVFDAGVYEDHVYLVMELVVGLTLAAWLLEERPPARDILRAFAQAGAGLAAAHRVGLAHGDVKPENLLVDAEGRVRVADFGLALVVRPRAPGEPPVGPVGTPGYMAPEVQAGRRPDPRADQYSFAVALQKALRDAGLRSGPRSLDRALARATASAPEARFASLDPLVAVLEAAARRPRPRPVLLAGGAAVALAAVAALAVGAGRRPAAAGGFAARCGNGRLDVGETCDDGNDVDDDGCSTCVRCPPDALGSVDGTCYTLHSQPVSWDEAAAVCEAQGAVLASFPHRGAASSVQAAHGARGVPLVWLGLRRAVGDGAGAVGLVWATGEPVDVSVRFRLPEGGADRGDCVAQAGLPEDGLWRLLPCTERLPFVCELRPWRVRPSTGHAYRVVHGRFTWAAARDVCARWGAHLATIADAEEQAFVAGLVSRYVWLGATDAEVEGRFVWTTGEPWSYTAFAAGQPNDRGGGRAQDCLSMGLNHRWHDWDCAAPGYAALCELE